MCPSLQQCNLCVHQTPATPLAELAPLPGFSAQNKHTPVTEQVWKFFCYLFTSTLNICALTL